MVSMIFSSPLRYAITAFITPQPTHQTVTSVASSTEIGLRSVSKFVCLCRIERVVAALNEKVREGGGAKRNHTVHRVAYHNKV